MTIYKYGMRLRPVGIGTQPNGLIKFEDSDKIKTGYWSNIWYERKLTPEETWRYELDFLGEEEEK